MNKLYNEIKNDPLGRGYPGMTDRNIAISLNTKDRAKINPLSSAELLAWAGGGANDTTNVASRYERIEQAASSHSSGVVRGACKAALRLIERDGTQLDLSLSDRVGMIDALVAGGVLSSDEKTELFDMATTYISRAEELGINKVYIADIMGVKVYG